MYDAETVRQAFELRRGGMTQAEVAEEVGVSLGQLRKWFRTGEEAVLHSPMRTAARPCGAECVRIADVTPADYAYLLGQYLGDGSIVRMRRVFKLSITTCDDYPHIRQLCADAIRAVMPDNAVMLVKKAGCHDVYAYSKHWPCLFPQHGAGRKHERPIVLDEWQRRIALDMFAGPFVRGLIHSDGCRVINRVTSKGRRYAYTRYMFTNRSADIRALFIQACEALGVEARHSNACVVSVARRAGVEVLETIVGPKS